MTGTFYEPPSNPGYDPFAARAQAPRGVPLGRQADQVIVDIPRHHDPQFAPTSAEDNAAIDATLAHADAYGGQAAPFDPDAYAAAQAKASGMQEEKGTDPEDVETILDLTDAERADLNDFFTVGRRRGEVKVLGHTVQCQSLNSWDEMNIGKFVAPYMNTPGFVRAWTVATAAAGIRSINGRRIYDELAPIEDEAELFDEKVRKVARAFPYAITPVYDKVQELDAEFNAIAERLNSGKTSG